MLMRIKALGVALLALAALACASAGIASARIVHDFKSTNSTVILTGEQISGLPIRFEFGSKSVLTCGLNKLNGTQSLPSSKLTVEPTSSSCLLNEMAATVNYNGCREVFSGETGTLSHGSLSIECGFAKKIFVEVTGCRIEIGEQTIPEAVGYKETEWLGVKDVDMILTAANGTYSKTGFLCGGIGGTGSDLGIFGTYTMQAYEDNEGKEGSQLSLTYETTTLP